MVFVSGSLQSMLNYPNYAFSVTLNYFPLLLIFLLIFAVFMLAVAIITCMNDNSLRAASREFSVDRGTLTNGLCNINELHEKSVAVHCA